MDAISPHAIGTLHSLQLGSVSDNADPDGRGRVKVRLHATEMEVWASVVTPSAGHNYGIAFIPRVDEIVVVAFVSPELPLVLGALWSGGDSVPEDADTVEDHYVVRTPSGSVLELDNGDGPTVSVTTPQGHMVKVTDGNGGEVVIQRGGQEVKLTSSEISITSSGTISVEGSSVSISASSVTVDAGMSRFSGVIQADTVITNSVVSSSYTPGAGNTW